MGVAANVPDDVLERAAGWLEKEDVLLLRALSPRGRDVAKRAISRKAILDVREVKFVHVEPHEPSPVTFYGPSLEMRAPARAVTAMGRVFGAGCVKLQACGKSPEKLVALPGFVLSTGRGLLELNLGRASVSSDFLVELCRLAPNLISLYGPSDRDTTLDAIQQISSLCPKLEKVDFATSWTEFGPAEEWERHFPNLRSLKLCNGYVGYQPTKLSVITEAAHATSAAEVDCDGCVVLPALIDAIVGTPLGDRITTFGCGRTNNGTNIDPEAFLAAARGFPRLTEIGISEETTLPAPSWIADLARIRPLKSLIFAAENTTNAHVVAAFVHNQLESLELTILPDLTAGLGDAVAGTQTAAVLRVLEINYCDQIRAADVLSLAKACPAVTKLDWMRNHAHWDPEDGWNSDEEMWTEAEIAALLVSRGGKFVIW
jgi:hypothetical protein